LYTGGDARRSVALDELSRRITPVVHRAVGRPPFPVAPSMATNRLRGRAKPACADGQFRQAGTWIALTGAPFLDLRVDPVIQTGAALPGLREVTDDRRRPPRFAQRPRFDRQGHAVPVE
jgi:hypothetical protein